MDLFTLNVFIDMFGFMLAILLFVFYISYVCCSSVPSLLSFFALRWYFLKYHFSSFVFNYGFWGFLFFSGRSWGYNIQLNILWSTSHFCTFNSNKIQKLCSILASVPHWLLCYFFIYYIYVYYKINNSVIIIALYT